MLSPLDFISSLRDWRSSACVALWVYSQKSNVVCGFLPPRAGSRWAHNKSLSWWNEIRPSRRNGGKEFRICMCVSACLWVRSLYQPLVTAVTLPPPLRGMVGEHRLVFLSLRMQLIYPLLHCLYISDVCIGTIKWQTTTHTCCERTRRDGVLRIYSYVCQRGTICGAEG